MNDSLLWPNPPQLAIAGHMPPKPSHVGSELFKRVPDDQMPQRFDGLHAQIVASSNCERQAVPFQACGVIGLQHDVRRRVIRVWVHRVRTIETARGGEANVMCCQINDASHS